MEGPLRRLCVLRDDTLVQYAACLLAFLFMGRAVAQFDSDYSGEEGTSTSILFAGTFEYILHCDLLIMDLEYY